MANKQQLHTRQLKNCQQYIQDKLEILQHIQKVKTPK